MRKCLAWACTILAVVNVNYYLQWYKMIHEVSPTAHMTSRPFPSRDSPVSQEDLDTSLVSLSMENTVATTEYMQMCSPPTHTECNITIVLHPRPVPGRSNDMVLGHVHVQEARVVEFGVDSSVLLVTVNRSCHVLGTEDFRTSARKPYDLRYYMRRLPEHTVVAGAARGYSRWSAELPTIWKFPFPLTLGYHKFGRVAFVGMTKFPGNFHAVQENSDEKTLRHEQIINLGNTYPLSTPLDQQVPSAPTQPGHALLEAPSWAPVDCVPRSVLALIVPYRNRPQHLRWFLDYINNFLKLQRLAFTIYIVEQAVGELFNRAALMNVGYLEARKDYTYDCYIFHDVDLLPEDLANSYACAELPRHLAVTRSQTKYEFLKAHRRYFGGVVSLTERVIRDINGFPYRMFGWGGEDDDIYNRVKGVKNYTILRESPFVGRYYSMPHTRDIGNPRTNTDRTVIDKNIARSIRKDGLNTSFGKYTILKTAYTDLYVNISVQIHKKNDTLGGKHPRISGACNKSINPRSLTWNCVLLLVVTLLLGFY